MWDGVKGQVGYAAKQKEVEDFNKSHAWLKRGVAVTPTRSPTLCAVLVSFRVFLLRFKVLIPNRTTALFVLHFISCNEQRSELSIAR